MPIFSPPHSNIDDSWISPRINKSKEPTPFYIGYRDSDGFHRSVELVTFCWVDNYKDKSGFDLHTITIGMQKWLEESCKTDPKDPVQKYYWGGYDTKVGPYSFRGSIGFLHPEDALAFKLIWLVR